MLKSKIIINGKNGEYGSELPFAETVAAHLQIPLVKVDATPKRIKSAISATVKALDLPFGDGVTVPISTSAKLIVHLSLRVEQSETLAQRLPEGDSNRNTLRLLRCRSQ